ncbi:MAG: glycosyltransferase family 2 protein [Candidatus Zambryskibacteria bacterium]|nr:glycosyltransferase family 2 protein [Candidatus Zambryskibacteria bacterium]
MISVVVPAYNEEKNVAELHKRLMEVFRNVKEKFEIIIVANGSKDNTLAELKKLSPIKIVSIAYNIGQTAGIDAGIHAASGDLIFTMDADLQNDPADISAMLNKMKEGNYDIVVGWRKERRDSFGRRFFSSFANKVTRTIAGLNIHDYGCAMRVFKKKYLEDVHLYGVMHVFIPVIMASRGAKVGEMVVHHHERKAGTTHYTFLHMVTDIADLVTIKFLYTYAVRPMVFFGTLALTSLGIAFLAVLASVIIKMQFAINLNQTPLPVISALFIILGFLLFMLGFIVELLIRIYYEARGVTPYKISEVIER